MEHRLRFAAVGFAVLSICWQDACGQAPAVQPPPAGQAAPAAAPSPAPVAAEQPATQPPQEAVAQEADQADEAATIQNPLEEIEWLVGDWVDQDENATVETAVNWTKNGRFLTRTFRIVPKEGEPHSGLQLIGWDPAQQIIRSWTYDSNGGFGEESWRRIGERWTIRTKYTLPDGERASATQLIQQIDDNSFSFRSVNRIIGGALQPDIDEVIVVRKAPEGVAQAPSEIPVPAAESAPAPAAPPEAAAPVPAPAAPEQEKKP